MNKIVAFIFYLFLVFHVQQSFAADGQLLAGTSKINITPSSDEPLHDSVYARVLILDMDGKRIAFVSVDLAVFTSKRLEEYSQDHGSEFRS